jgi:DNA polymerase I-like protein with 3'-5' exonuclease and polymerase domains
LRQDWTARKQEVAAEAGRIYEVREFERHMQKPFSISNPNDVGQALAVYGRVPLPKTGSGKWSTDDAILEKQCKDHPLVSCVHRYREAAKIISTYIEPVTKARQDNADGQLHPGYTTMLTATGRLSSHEPNIQNFPRRRHKEVRRQIVAPDRHLMLAFDYGQLEARVIAMASRDQQLCDAIMHGYDVHQHWLDRLLKLYPTYLQTIAERTGKRDPAAVRKAARDAIKTDFVFSSFFGSAPKNCAANIGAPLEIVQQLAEEFWLEFRGVRNWLKARHREYRDTGAIRTLTGRVRRALLWGNEPINCVDFATEALTQRGWVDGHDLEAGDVLLTMNPQSQLLEWQSVTEVKRFPGYSGPVHYLAGKSFSAVTTPEHRWAYYKDGANKALHECTSATLPAWGSIPRVRPFNGPKRAVYSDDWVRLVGWVVTDGCYNHGGGSKQAAPAWDYRRSQECGYSGSQVTICQRKPENITEIDALCSRLPFPVRSKLPNNRGDEAFWHFSGQAGRWFHGMLPERILTPEFLLRLPQAQLEILFETMIKGDGWVDAGQEGFCSGSKAQIDAFQMLSVLSGRLVNVAYHDFSEHQPERYLSMPNVPNSKGAWYARRAKRENVSLGWLQREVKVEQRGMWCPMVPNTFFVARREGKVYITGNTPIQGTAADIVVDAMNAMTEQALRQRDRYLLPRMQIHDDLTFILPDDADLPRYIESISACLVAVRFDWQIVPLTVEAKIGTNWAELEEFAVFTGGYRR